MKTSASIVNVADNPATPVDLAFAFVCLTSIVLADGPCRSQDACVCFRLLFEAAMPISGFKHRQLRVRPRRKRALTGPGASAQWTVSELSLAPALRRWLSATEAWRSGG